MFFQVNEADKSAKGVKGSQCEVKEKAEPAEGIEEGEARGHQVHDGKSSSSGQKVKLKQKKVREAMVGVALPFLQGVSPAGHLSASKRQPGGSDHVIQVMWPLRAFFLLLPVPLLSLNCSCCRPLQVNGRPYPLAKIQLGLVGALHPANRLAAYLTGRVQSSRAAAAVPPPPSPTGRTQQIVLLVATGSNKYTPLCVSSISTRRRSVTCHHPSAPEPSGAHASCPVGSYGAPCWPESADPSLPATA